MGFSSFIPNPPFSFYFIIFFFVYQIGYGGRLDVQLPHQPINPLSGADHFPPDHVKQGVQPGGWLLLMQGDELTG